MAAGKKLASTVHVSDEQGRVHRFGPDDDLPAWARKAITNPKAYGENPDEDQPAGLVLGDEERAEAEKGSGKSS